MQRQVLVIQKAQRTVDVPLLQYIGTTVHVPVAKQHEDCMTKYNETRWTKDAFGISQDREQDDSITVGVWRYEVNTAINLWLPSRISDAIFAIAIVVCSHICFATSPSSAAKMDCAKCVRTRTDPFKDMAPELRAPEAL